MAKLKDQYVVVVISNAPTVVYLGLQDNGGITDAGVMGAIAILKDKLVRGDTVLSPLSYIPPGAKP